MSTGKIVQVMGPVVDVAFESVDLPEIYTALEIQQKGYERIICEVQQHLGDHPVSQRTHPCNHLHQQPCTHHALH